MSRSGSLRSDLHSPLALAGSRLGTIGVLTVICGVLALVWPGLATVAINYFVGALMIFAGGLQLSASRLRLERRWLGIVGGLLYIAAGVLLFIRPLAGIVSLTLLLAWLLLISGAFRIAAALSGEVQEHRVLVVLSGLASVFVGWIALRYLPVVSPWMLGIFYGVDMLFIGFAMFGLSQEMRAIAPPVSPGSAGRPV
jgi:uncharacterized membrane protein HdeD (DUF308 family)